VPVHDNLNATLWMQKSAEYKANAVGAFALAKFRLEQGLAHLDWTALPEEQKGDFKNLPPAIIVDVDETVMDNSRYQAWLVQQDKTFDQESWAKFCHAQVSEAVPGAADFLAYANSRGVKVFYISNRTADLEESTRANMKRLGFPLGGNVDTLLFAKEQKDWGSAKSTRRAYVAKDYRVILNIGDNFGDFTDAYKGTEAERLAVMNDNQDRWGREWIMISNPSYGSWESAYFKHDFKVPADEQRLLKRQGLDAWNGN
jgi:5'-nucleotidase (lipoprotein e(P4) family)